MSFQRGSFRATDWCRGKRLRIHGCATLKVRGCPNALISGVRLSVALRLDRSRDRESEVRRCEKIARQAKPPAPPSFANPCTASEVGQTVSSAGPPEIRFFAASHGRGFWLAIIRLTVSFRINLHRTTGSGAGPWPIRPVAHRGPMWCVKSKRSAAMRSLGALSLKRRFRAASGELSVNARKRMTGRTGVFITLLWAVGPLRQVGNRAPQVEWLTP